MAAIDKAYNIDDLALRSQSHGFIVDQDKPEPDEQF